MYHVPHISWLLYIHHLLVFVKCIMRTKTLIDEAHHFCTFSASLARDYYTSRVKSGQNAEAFNHQPVMPSKTDVVLSSAAQGTCAVSKAVMGKSTWRVVMRPGF